MMAMLRICIALNYNRLSGIDTSERGGPRLRAQVTLASIARRVHNAIEWSQYALRRRWPMNEHDEASLENYPHGRGYGHDYMRGGEVLGGYGYAERSEYDKRRGELMGDASTDASYQLSPQPSDEAETRT